MLEISSKENKIIKNYLKLLQSKYRHEQGLYLDYGMHALNEISDKFLIKEVLSTDEKIATIKVTPAILKLFQSNKSVIDPVIVVKQNETKDLTNCILLLDGIQIPDNLGAIFRASVAFGIKTIILTNQTCDAYNEKAVRASQGAINKLNIIRITDTSLFYNNLVNDGYTIYATLHGDRDSLPINQVKFSDKFCLVMGSEGQGINKELLPNIYEKIYIPIKNIESLNVGIATSIILYEWSKSL